MLEIGMVLHNKPTRADLEAVINDVNDSRKEALKDKGIKFRYPYLGPGSS